MRVGPQYPKSAATELAGLRRDVEMLKRRLFAFASSTAHGWDISAVDGGQALRVWDGRDSPPSPYARSNFGWAGDAGGTAPPGFGNLPFDSVIFDSDGYFNYIDRLDGFFSAAGAIPAGLGGYYICTALLEIGADSTVWDELNYPSNPAVTSPPRFKLAASGSSDSYHGWWSITGASPSEDYEAIYVVTASGILLLPEGGGPVVSVDLTEIPTAILLRTRLSGFLLDHQDGLGFEDPQWPPPGD